jgi:hypothetical protein
MYEYTPEDYLVLEMQCREASGLPRVVRFEHMQTALGYLPGSKHANLRKIIANSGAMWKVSPSHGFSWVHDDTVDAETIFRIAFDHWSNLNLKREVVHFRLAQSIPCPISSLVSSHPFLPLKFDTQTGTPKRTQYGDLLRFIRRYPDRYRIQEDMWVYPCTLDFETDPGTYIQTSAVRQTDEGIWVKHFRDAAEFGHSVTILNASGSWGPRFHTDTESQTIRMDHSGQPMSEYLHTGGVAGIGSAEIHAILTQTALYLGSLHSLGLYHGDLLTERAHRLLSPVLTDCGIHLGNVLVRPDDSLCFIDPHTPTAAMRRMEEAFVSQWTPVDSPMETETTPDGERGYVTPTRGTSERRRCRSSPPLGSRVDFSEAPVDVKKDYTANREDLVQCRLCF